MNLRSDNRFEERRPSAILAIAPRTVRRPTARRPYCPFGRVPTRARARLLPRVAQSAIPSRSDRAARALAWDAAPEVRRGRDEARGAAPRVDPHFPHSSDRLALARSPRTSRRARGSRKTPDSRKARGPSRDSAPFRRRANLSFAPRPANRQCGPSAPPDRGRRRQTAQLSSCRAAQAQSPPTPLETRPRRTEPRLPPPAPSIEPLAARRRPALKEPPPRPGSPSRLCRRRTRSLPRPRSPIHRRRTDGPRRGQRPLSLLPPSQPLRRPPHSSPKSLPRPSLRRRAAHVR